MAKSYPTLAIPWTRLPGPSVHEISWARILECVAISFSGDLPDPGIESDSPAWQADSLPLSHQGSQVIYVDSTEQDLTLLNNTNVWALHGVVLCLISCNPCNIAISLLKVSLAGE